MTESSRISPDGDGLTNLAVRVLATIRMRIPNRKRKEARSILVSMIERIKLEEGCLSCRLYQDALEGEAIMFEGLWADEKCLTKHLRSDEYRNVLLVAEMASEPPEIQFHRISRSTGMRTVEDALRTGRRGQSNA